MENLERRVHNLEKHIENIVKTMQEDRPVIEFAARKNVLCAFAIVVSIGCLILLFVLKG
jgi:hypothetical protein